LTILGFFLCAKRQFRPQPIATDSRRFRSFPTASRRSWEHDGKAGAEERTKTDKADVVDIRESIAKFTPNGPLVFINACRGGELGSLLYPNFAIAREFLKSSAACVVGPQIPVPAGFAAQFGRCFFEEFIRDTKPSPQVGELLKSTTRHFWKGLNPLGLVYSLYAHADCHIRWQ
jgi:hypothetical protein